MDQYKSALITFVCVYIGSILARATVGKEKHHKTFTDGLKDLSNHKVAAIIALIAAVSTKLS
ncbi:MAG: hypothetical protein KDD38_08415 [Bdellovibrionales bacterium]|nr:hypothetical protein [Bdellovibrionales bacterium]